MFQLFIIGIAPLTIFLGASFYLFCPQILSEQWYTKNPLEKKGIFNPIYKVKIFILFIVADLIWKINIFHWAHFWEEDDGLDYDVIAIFWGLVCIFFTINILCKYLLPKIEIRNIRKSSISTNYSKIGIIISVVITIDVIISLLIQQNTYWFTNKTLSLIISTFCVLAIGLVCVNTYLFFKRLDRIKNEAKRTINSLKTHRAPIIFLRSFEIDKYIIKGFSFDEYVCKSFSMTSQPILSLSDPNDFLPTGGSIKIQSVDAKWKNAIIELFKNCRAVVIFEGKSEGLQWEIENLKKYITHDKLFVATPPQKYRKDTWCRALLKKERKYALNYIWSQFEKYLNKEGFKLPNSDPGGDAIFSFDEKWNSIENGKKLHGMAMFNYILDHTIQYEKTECNYQYMAKELSSYELSKNFTEDERKEINKSIFKIYFIVIFVLVLITIIFA